LAHFKEGIEQGEPTSAQAARDATLKATFAVTLVVFASKALGFVREMVAANYLGLSAYRDAYTTANTILYIPILLFNSCLFATLVPMYTETRELHGPRHSARYVGNVVSVFTLASLAVLALMLVFSPLIVLAMTGRSNPLQYELTLTATRLMMPALVMNVVSIVFSAVLNARRRFVPSQLMGFPLSLCGIVALMMFGGRQYEQMTAQALSVVVASVIQVAILVPFVHRKWRFELRPDFGDERIRRMIRLAAPAMMAMGVGELNHTIDRMIANRLGEGSVSALGSAYILVTFALGVFSVPLTTVMFTRMSERATRGDRHGIGELVKESVGVLSLVVVPIMALSMALGGDIIALAFRRGRFGDAEVTRTATVFAFYALGILAFSLRDVLTRAFNAMKNTRTPMIVALVSVALNVILNLILSRYMGAAGLALATSIAGAVGAVMMLWLLRARLGGMELYPLVIELLKTTVAGVLCGVAAWVMSGLMPVQRPTAMGTFIHLVVCAGSGLAVYALAVYGLRIRQAGTLGDMIHSVMRRR